MVHNEVAMAELSANLQLTGETVTVSYVADPSLGYGRFRLENSGGAAVNAAVKEVWLEMDGQRQPLSGTTVFDRGIEQMVDPHGFDIDAGATLEFLVGFPRRAYAPRFGESTYVGLALSVDGEALQARSEIRFVRRIPKRGGR